MPVTESDETAVGDAVPLPDPLEPVEPFNGLLTSWELALRAENRADNTIDSYLEGITLLARWLTLNGHPDDPNNPGMRQHIRTWIADLNATRAPATARNRYGTAQQFFRWLKTEGEIATNPMDGMRPPAVPPVPVDVLTEETIRALLAACAGRDFTALRDTAMLRFLIDTGVRRSELAGLNVTDVDLRERVARVMGKGSRPRVVPFGSRTALALDRYLRARRQHPWATSPNLWLGANNKPPITKVAVGRMVERYGEKIGVPMHTHQFRHTMSHEWLSGGGNEGDLMRINGWRSRAMLDRYGASAADARARDAHRQHGLGDRI